MRLPRLRNLLGAFSPNRILSPLAMRSLVFVQAAVAILIWVNSPFKILPTPGEVLKAFHGLWFSQGLSRELMTSFLLNLEAIGISLVISLALSYLTVLPFFRPIVTAVSKGRFLGLIGLTFIFTLMVGGGRPLKLSLLVFGMTVFFVTSMASVVMEIPEKRFNYVRTMQMKEWRVVWEVVILGTADKAIEVLRQNAAIGWMMLTMVEGISRSEGGVGAMLLNQNKHFHLPEVFAIQVTILLLGLFQDWVIGVAENWMLPYVRVNRGRA